MCAGRAVHSLSFRFPALGLGIGCTTELRSILCNAYLLRSKLIRVQTT